MGRVTRYDVFGLVLVGVILAFVTWLGIRSAAEQEPGAAGWHSRSLGERLAFIDGQGKIQDEAVTRRFDAILQRLSERCYEDKTAISDLVVYSQKQLHGDGIDQSMLELIEGLCTVAYVGPRNTLLAGYVEQYCEIRRNGFTHADTVVSMRARAALDAAADDRRRPPP